MPDSDVAPSEPVAGPEGTPERLRAKRRHRCSCGCGELAGPAPKREPRPADEPAALARILALTSAYRERMTSGDVEVIAGLAKLRHEVDEALDVAVIAGRAAHDLSWSQVAELTGLTRRGAIKKWGEVAPGTRTTGGQPADKR